MPAEKLRRAKDKVNMHVHRLSVCVCMRGCFRAFVCVCRFHTSRIEWISVHLMELSVCNIGSLCVQFVLCVCVCASFCGLAAAVRSSQGDL